MALLRFAPLFVSAAAALRAAPPLVTRAQALRTAGAAAAWRRAVPPAAAFTEEDCAPAASMSRPSSTHP